MAERTYSAEKTEAISGIRDLSEKSGIMILTDHNGLTVAQFNALRDKLYSVNAGMKVVKNTLAARAIKAEPADKLRELLNGPSSIIFGGDDVVGPAKVLAAFIKENEKPSIKGAVMDGALVDTAVVKKLASLPSKEVLLAKVVGGIKSPLTGLVNVLQGPLRKLVYALNEISKKKGVQ